MKTYRITATGREKGAEGIVYPFTDIVEAESDSMEDILLALLQGKTASGTAWEHVMPRRIEEQPRVAIATQQKGNQ
jgi:hypothetical protein